MQPLSDPQKDRQIKSVKPPPHRPLSTELMYPDKLNNKPDWKLLKGHLQREGKILKKDFLKLIQQANEIFKNEGNIVYIQDPVSVVGDIHGQYYDLMKILEIGGYPENTKYLFLGDFVDRGSFSLEVIILLYAIKINFPSTVYFIRGNHECRQMTSFFNFRDECLFKYDQEIYDVLMDSFDFIPLVCIINGKFMGTHGGISPDLRTLDDVKKINRFSEPPREGIFCDLIWSDPVENDQGFCENKYKSNEVRGCSYFFGLDAVSTFLQNNQLLSVIRAHEAQIDGYKMHRWNGNDGFPCVITIFSAANYCDVYNNKGAIIKFENNTLNIQQFNYSQHPYLLPNFMDIFTWSIPFVSEKVNEMLFNIIKPGENEEMDSEEEEKYNQLMQQNTNLLPQQQQKPQTIAPVKQQSQPKISAERAQQLRNKIKFVSKMVILNKTLRENHEQLVKLKGASPDNRIPIGLLSQGTEGIQSALDKFKNARKIDLINEKRPSFKQIEQKH